MENFFRTSVNEIDQCIFTAVESSFKNIFKGPGMEASSKGPNRVGVLLFSPSIRLKMEAEPASKTL
jgi:hypothetical protein